MTPHPSLTMCRLDLEVYSSLKFLGVIIDNNDNKFYFEKHICNIAFSIAQKTSLVRKCYKTLGNNDTELKSF